MTPANSAAAPLPDAPPEPPRAPAFNRPLRIGVMLDGPHTPRWVMRVIEEINATPFLQLSLVVFDATHDTAAAPARSWRGWLARQKAALPYRLWEWYQAADYRRFRDERHDPFASTDVAPAIAGVETLNVTPQRTRFVDRFADADVERVKAANLDVMLRFGFRIIKGGILGAARFGVWSLHHDDNRSYRGGPALFWEMYEGNVLSGTVLQVLTEQLDGGRVIYRSIAATQFASLYKNRQEIYWKSAALVTRRLGDLWREGWDYLASLETYREPDTYCAVSIAGRPPFTCCGFSRAPTDIESVASCSNRSTRDGSSPRDAAARSRPTRRSPFFIRPPAASTPTHLSPSRTAARTCSSRSIATQIARA